MPVYQYEGQHYDLPDGLTNEQAIAKIEAHLGRSQPKSNSLMGDFTEGAKGTLAAVGDVAAGLVKVPATAALAVGGKLADPSLTLNQTYEAAQAAMEDTMPSFGRNMQDNLGYTVPMKPFELYGKGIDWAGEKAGELTGSKDVEGAVRVGGSVAPIPFAGRAGRVIQKGLGAIDPTLRNVKAPERGPDLAGLAEELNKKPAPVVEAPRVDMSVPASEQLRINQERIEALRREAELARQSAFNRPDSLPDLERQTPMERMATELGAKPGEVPVRPDQSPMARVAADLQERPSTGRQMEVQDALERRQKQLEEEVAKAVANDVRPTEPQLAAIRKIQDDIAFLKDRAEQERIARDTARMENAHQPELFEGLDHGYGPNPHDIGGAQHWTVDEHGIPIRADLSMEAANLENPLQRNLWGDELAPKHEQEGVPLTQAIDSMSREQAREGGKFVPGTPKSIATQRLTGNPLPLGSAARRALMRKQGGMINPKVFTEGFQKAKELANGLKLKAFSDGTNLIIKAMRGNQEVGGVMFNKTSPTATPMHTDIQAPMVRSNERGVATEMYKFASELGNDIVPTKFHTPAGAEMWKGFERKGLSRGGYIPKGQKGAVLFPFGKDKERNVMKGIPGIKDKIGDLLPDQRDNATFLKEEANTPDVDQNWLQRASNQLTKGSLYQAMKTQNPLIKRVGDRVRDANNTARGIIADVIHTKLAPAAQALSKAERTDLMMAMQLAESKGVPLSADTLRARGFSEKQIKFFNEHTDAMKIALEKLNEATKAGGEGPVTARVAYLASRANGDFRRLIYKEVDGEKVPVAILGADTRGKLNRDVERLQKEHPEWVVGEERYYGGSASKANKAAGLREAMEFLAQNNPEVKALADHINDLMTKDAYEYMNAKSHTMAKKGIEGMTGRKMFEDAETNAREAMQAQVDYFEKVVTWAELSKAVEDLKPLLHDDNGLNMPKAKEWSKDYIQTALGYNPSKIGRAIDQVFGAIGETTGVGSSVGGRIVKNAKRLTNGLLLGFGNIGFLAANMIQPMKSMPEMASFLAARGLEKKFDAGTGFRYLAQGVRWQLKELNGEPLPKYIKDAYSYAEQKHVYSSDLFDTSNSVSRDFGHYWDKGTQIGAGWIEKQTRQAAYLSYVELLHENGLTKADGLYEAAHNLTDLQMNNYNTAEAPKVYSHAGGVGKTAYNLMSYKHNELSRLAMLAREFGRTKDARPLAANILSSIAFAGIIGTIGYTEADWFVRQVSKAMGKPTSLTKELLDNPNIPDKVKFGGAANLGVDMSARMGTGAILPKPGIDAFMPGAGKLVTAGQAMFDAVTSPSEYNAKNAIREMAPNSVSGLLDRMWFSGKDAKGNELAMNRNKVSASATRNEADKMYKTLGMTGINEAKQKAGNYEDQYVNKAYQDIRKSVVEKAAKEYFVSGKFPNDFAKKYILAQGDPNSIERELTQIVMEQNIDPKTAAILKNSMSNSVTSMHRLMRAVGKE